LVGNEEELLLRALDKSSYETALVVRRCLATGMCRGELMTIMIRDIDQKRKCLMIPKTKTDHAREIPLTDEAFDSLAKQFIVIINSVRQIYPEAAEVSIARLQGKGKAVSLRTHKDISNSFMVFHMKPDSISKAFSRAYEMTGIEGLTFHDLRPKAISRLF
jgi:integrase